MRWGGGRCREGVAGGQGWGCEVDVGFVVGVGEGLRGMCACGLGGGA